MLVSSLYTPPAVLWVEDQASYEYLLVVWSDPQIRLLIGGGRDGVRGMVNQARSERHTHVFGLIDRDFDASNRGRWASPATCPSVFRPEVHEIENYLLDADALAGCP